MPEVDRTHPVPQKANPDLHNFVLPSSPQGAVEITSDSEELLIEEAVKLHYDDTETEEEEYGMMNGDSTWPNERDSKTLSRRPWYRLPSAWWMHILMPLSAMSIAGVQPSAVQIYTDLVCRALRPDLLSSFAPTQNVQQTCASDPNVQAVASKLMTSVMTSLGILSCITAASWASLSDRIGRKPILAIASVGALCSYLVLVFVYAYAELLPGGFWFCVVGASLHGLLGGTATASAVTIAYITDCTPPSATARMLSLFWGLRFSLRALGPTLCAFLVQIFGTPVAAVYFVVFIQAFYFLTVVFVVPESLSWEKKEGNRVKWNAARVRRADGSDSKLSLVADLAAKPFAFLRPLEVIKPVAVFSAISGRSSRDWSLTLVAISSSITSLITASNQSQSQYGAATFGWTAVELGYLFSAVDGARAFTLNLLIPVISKLYQHIISSTPNDTTGDSISERTPLLSDASDSNECPPKRTIPHKAHIPSFDLHISQLSLSIELSCYALIPLFAALSLSVYKPIYVSLSILSAFGAGSGPAAQSLAAELYTQRGGTESGKLFGTLSVIQAICSQIIGPILYGLTYSAIVITYPQGIFFVSCGAVSLALVALFFVKLPKALTAAA